MSPEVSIPQMTDRPGIREGMVAQMHSTCAGSEPIGAIEATVVYGSHSFHIGLTVGLAFPQAIRPE
jgi:hypothetical protein